MKNQNIYKIKSKKNSKTEISLTFVRIGNIAINDIQKINFWNQYLKV